MTITHGTHGRSSLRSQGFALGQGFQLQPQWCLSWAVSENPWVLQMAHNLWIFCWDWNPKGDPVAVFDEFSYLLGQNQTIGSCYWDLLVKSSRWVWMGTGIWHLETLETHFTGSVLRGKQLDLGTQNSRFHPASHTLLPSKHALEKRRKTCLSNNPCSDLYLIWGVLKHWVPL